MAENSHNSESKNRIYVVPPDLLKRLGIGLPKALGTTSAPAGSSTSRNDSIQALGSVVPSTSTQPDIRKLALTTEIKPKHEVPDKFEQHVVKPKKEFIIINSNKPVQKNSTIPVVSCVLNERHETVYTELKHSPTIYSMPATILVDKASIIPKSEVIYQHNDERPICKSTNFDNVESVCIKQYEEKKDNIMQCPSPNLKPVWTRTALEISPIKQEITGAPESLVHLKKPSSSGNSSNVDHGNNQETVFLEIQSKQTKSVDRNEFDLSRQSAYLSSDMLKVSVQNKQYADLDEPTPNIPLIGMIVHTDEGSIASSNEFQNVKTDLENSVEVNTDVQQLQHKSIMPLTSSNIWDVKDFGVSNMDVDESYHSLGVSNQSSFFQNADESIAQISSPLSRTNYIPITPTVFNFQSNLTNISTLYPLSYSPVIQQVKHTEKNQFLSPTSPSSPHKKTYINLKNVAPIKNTVKNFTIIAPSPNRKMSINTESLKMKLAEKLQSPTVMRPDSSGISMRTHINVIPKQSAIIKSDETESVNLFKPEQVPVMNKANSIVDFTTKKEQTDSFKFVGEKLKSSNMVRPSSRETLKQTFLKVVPKQSTIIKIENSEETADHHSFNVQKVHASIETKNIVDSAKRRLKETLQLVAPEGSMSQVKRSSTKKVETTKVPRNIASNSDISVVRSGSKETLKQQFLKVVPKQSNIIKFKNSEETADHHSFSLQKVHASDETKNIVDSAKRRLKETLQQVAPEGSMSEVKRSSTKRVESTKVPRNIASNSDISMVRSGSKETLKQQFLKVIPKQSSVIKIENSEETADHHSFSLQKVHASNETKNIVDSAKRRLKETLQQVAPEGSMSQVKRSSTKRVESTKIPSNIASNSDISMVRSGSKVTLKQQFLKVVPKQSATIKLNNSEETADHHSFSGKKVHAGDETKNIVDSAKRRLKETLQQVAPEGSMSEVKRSSTKRVESNEVPRNIASNSDISMVRSGSKETLKHQFLKVVPKQSSIMKLDTSEETVNRNSFRVEKVHASNETKNIVDSAKRRLKETLQLVAPEGSMSQVKRSSRKGIESTKIPSKITTNSDISVKPTRKSKRNVSLDSSNLTPAKIPKRTDSRRNSSPIEDGFKGFTDNKNVFLCRKLTSTNFSKMYKSKIMDRKSARNKAQSKTKSLLATSSQGDEILNLKNTLKCRSYTRKNKSSNMKKTINDSVSSDITAEKFTENLTSGEKYKPITMKSHSVYTKRNRNARVRVYAASVTKSINKDTPTSHRLGALPVSQTVNNKLISLNMSSIIDEWSVNDNENTELNNYTTTSGGIVKRPGENLIPGNEIGNDSQEFAVKKNRNKSKKRPQIINTETLVQSCEEMRETEKYDNHDTTQGTEYGMTSTDNCTKDEFCPVYVIIDNNSDTSAPITPLSDTQLDNSDSLIADERATLTEVVTESFSPIIENNTLPMEEITFSDITQMEVSNELSIKKSSKQIVVCQKKSHVRKKAIKSELPDSMSTVSDNAVLDYDEVIPKIVRPIKKYKSKKIVNIHNTEVNVADNCEPCKPNQCDDLIKIESNTLPALSKTDLNKAPLQMHKNNNNRTISGKSNKSDNITFRILPSTKSKEIQLKKNTVEQFKNNKKTLRNKKSKVITSVIKKKRLKKSNNRFHPEIIPSNKAINPPGNIIESELNKIVANINESVVGFSSNKESVHSENKPIKSGLHIKNNISPLLEVKVDNVDDNIVECQMLNPCDLNFSQNIEKVVQSGADSNETQIVQMASATTSGFSLMNNFNIENGSVKDENKTSIDECNTAENIIKSELNKISTNIKESVVEFSSNKESIDSETNINPEIFPSNKAINPPENIIESELKKISTNIKESVVEFSSNKESIHSETNNTPEIISSNKAINPPENIIKSELTKIVTNIKESVVEFSSNKESIHSETNNTPEIISSNKAINPPKNIIKSKLKKIVTNINESVVEFSSNKESIHSETKIISEITPSNKAINLPENIIESELKKIVTNINESVVEFSSNKESIHSETKIISEITPSNKAIDPPENIIESESNKIVADVNESVVEFSSNKESIHSETNNNPEITPSNKAIKPPENITKSELNNIVTNINESVVEFSSNKVSIHSKNKPIKSRIRKEKNISPLLEVKVDNVVDNIGECQMLNPCDLNISPSMMVMRHIHDTDNNETQIVPMASATTSGMTLMDNFNIENGEIDECKKIKRKPGRPKKNAIEDADVNVTQPAPTKAILIKTVQCGVCKDDVNIKAWHAHKQKHNNLAWIEGDTPIDMTDEKLVERTLMTMIKARKKFICEVCGAHKRSAVGFMSHLQMCGKNDEEIDSMREPCPFCRRLMLPSSLKVHLPLHSKQEQPNQRVQPVPTPENDIGDETTATSRPKRAAATKAATNLKEFIDNNEKRDESKFKAISDIYSKPSSSTRISNSVIALWNREFYNTKDTTISHACCRYVGCTYKGTTLEEMREHHLKCELSTKLGYWCSLCSFRCTDESYIIEHVKTEHSAHIEKAKRTLIDENDDNYVPNEAEAEADSIAMDEECDDDVPKIRRSMTKAQTIFSFVENHHYVQTDKQTYQQGLKWTLKFQSENYSSVPLFPDWCGPLGPRVPAWQQDEYVGDSHSVRTATAMVMSNADTPSANDVKWKVYKRYVGDCDNGISTLFCGGPVWAMAWCPMPLSAPSSEPQYLAIATHKSWEDRFTTDNNLSDASQKSVIQIWDTGSLDNNLCKCVATPKLILAIAHDWGAVWDMKWCPSGGYIKSEAPDPESEDVNPDLGHRRETKRIGLLAVACSNGCVYIYSISLPKEHTELYSDFIDPVYKTKPVVILKLNISKNKFRQESFHATRICWSQEKGHAKLVAGYSNGLVALFNLSTTSSLLVHKEDGIDFIKPYHVFQPHLACVTGLQILPSLGSCYVFIGSTDRTFRFWQVGGGAGDSLHMPIGQAIVKARVNEAVWLQHWLAAVVSSDEAMGFGRSHSTLYPVRDTGYKNVTMLNTCSVAWALAGCEWTNGFVQGTEAGELTAIYPHQLIIGVDNDKHLRNRKMAFGYTEVLALEQVAEDKTIEKIGLNNLPPYKRLKAEKTKQENTNSENNSDDEWERVIDYMEDDDDITKLLESVGTHLKSSDNTTSWKSQKKTYKEMDEKCGLLFCDIPMDKCNQNSLLQSMRITNAPNYPLGSITKVSYNPNYRSYKYLAAATQAGFVRIRCITDVKANLKRV